MTFSDATLADVPALVSIHNDVAADLTTRFGKGHWSSVATERGTAHSLEHAKVRVGRSRGRIVTVLRLGTKKPWAIDVAYFTSVKRPLYLTGMAVVPSLQRQGLGRRAMDDAHEIALAWPADAIRLDAYDSPAGAGDFYGKCGYAERGHVVYKADSLVYYELILR